MSWAIGYDSTWNRDIGYGVPAYCDQPGCGAKIDRGLGYVCGGEPYGGDEGCGLYFCIEHRPITFCERCPDLAEPFEPTPDHPDWIRHKLTHDSWQRWRDENPEDVARMSAALDVEDA